MSGFLTRSLVFLLITAAAIKVHALCELDEACQTHKDELGSIQKISDCQRFKVLSPKKKRLFKTCGWSDGAIPLICCPNNLEIGSRFDLLNSTVSVTEMCESFGEFHHVISRIIGGRSCEVGEFPHFAQLGYRIEDRVVAFLCGGSLVSKRFVLTAAHCCKKTSTPTVVRLGKVRIFKVR